MALTDRANMDRYFVFSGLGVSVLILGRILKAEDDR